MKKLKYGKNRNEKGLTYNISEETRYSSLQIALFMKKY